MVSFPPHYMMEEYFFVTQSLLLFNRKKKNRFSGFHIFTSIRICLSFLPKTGNNRLKIPVNKIKFVIPLPSSYTASIICV